MMNQVYKTLPDDRPVTSICVVEDVDKVPKGYVVVSRTHDQDSDADLWRENTFFGKKCTRYICLSKTEGTPDRVVQSLVILSEKEGPPEGYTSLTRTWDSDQKAWRKRQLCYKSAPINSSPNAITDVIVLSKMKRAPDEFSLSGEINGMTLCYKVGKSKPNSGLPAVYPAMPYSLSPLTRPAPHAPTSPSLPPTYQNLSPLPSLNGHRVDNAHDYELLSPLAHGGPSRPAPLPPRTAQLNTQPMYGTISGYSGLEGVPFILNPKFGWTDSSSTDLLRGLSLNRPKTRAQIDEEFSYDFRTERET